MCPRCRGLEGDQRPQSKRDQAGDVTKVPRLAQQEVPADREGWDVSGNAELPLVLPAALTGAAPSRAHSRTTQGICCFSLCRRQPGDAPSARNISPALINVGCSWQQPAKDAIPRRAQAEFCAFLCRHQRKAAPPWAAAPELLLPVLPSWKTLSPHPCKDLLTSHQHWGSLVALQGMGWSRGLSPMAPQQW